MADRARYWEEWEGVRRVGFEKDGEVSSATKFC